MATTKLWHIKGRLWDLIEYVENPAKTADPSMQDFFNVFSYTQNPDKTDGGEFVTAINCVTGADDPDQEAVLQGRWLYRMARL